jgi:hypothetical protein
MLIPISILQEKKSKFKKRMFKWNSWILLAYWIDFYSASWINSNIVSLSIRIFHAEISILLFRRCLSGCRVGHLLCWQKYLFVLLIPYTPNSFQVGNPKIFIFCREALHTQRFKGHKKGSW